MQDMQPQPEMNPQVQTLDGGPDHEGALAKADLYKLAQYSFKLFKKLEDDAQLEAWVQAKITKAADYIASVYHYIEYEMEFSDYGSKLDNSEVYSESQKLAIKNKLMEAKSKVAELKKLKAEKLKDKKKVEEGTIFGGHEQACSECGGTGMVQVPERAVPEAVKEKVRKYNRQAKAFHAAGKRIDKNKNGIPDDEEMEEGFESGSKPGSTFKTRTGVATKTSSGVVHKNTSHSDEEHGEPASNVKAKSAAEKKADKEKEIKLPKHKGNTWGMKGGEKFGNGAKPAKKEKEEEVEEGQGGKMSFGQGVYEGKGKKAKKDYDKDGKIESEKDEVIGSRRRAAGLDEAKKPSAGLTKGQKSATVKAAKAGKDIGKPGKNFEKVAKAAEKGGAKDGEKVAAAAMWKAKSKAAVKEAIAKVKGLGLSEEAGMPSKINPVVDTREVFYVGTAPDGTLRLKVNDSKDLSALPKVEHLPKLDTPGYDIASKGFRAINIEVPGSKERVGAFMSGQYVYANKESFSKLQSASGKSTIKESAELDRMKEFLTRLNG